LSIHAHQLSNVASEQGAWRRRSLVPHSTDTRDFHLYISAALAFHLTLFPLFPLQALTSSPHYFYSLLIDLGRPFITHRQITHSLVSFNPTTFSNYPINPFQTTNQTTTINMRYTLIAAAIIGAVSAMPAAPASYGQEAPAAYGGESEQVYGTEVAPQQTTSAAEPTSTCTDESEDAVPYTSAMGYNAPPAYSAEVTSSASSPASPEETKPAGHASESMMASESGPAGYPSASATESSPEMPAESGPAGYDTPKTPEGETPKTPEGETPKTPMGETPKSPEGEAPKYPEGETPKSPEAETPESPKQTGGYMSSPPNPESETPAGEAAPPAEYGTAVVPGVAPTSAPYPVGETPAGYAAPSGTAGAAMPTGTGSVGGDHTEFEGAASSLNIAGLFVSFGAVAAFFM